MCRCEGGRGSEGSTFKARGGGGGVPALCRPAMHAFFCKRCPRQSLLAGLSCELWSLQQPCMCMPGQGAWLDKHAACRTRRSFPAAVLPCGINRSTSGTAVCGLHCVYLNALPVALLTGGHAAHVACAMLAEERTHAFAAEVLTAPPCAGGEERGQRKGEKIGSCTSYKGFAGNMGYLGGDQTSWGEGWQRRARRSPPAAANAMP